MSRSRQLFLRSRLELAAELEQNAPRIPDFAKSKREVVYFLSLLFINLPFAFIYGPTYFFLYHTSGWAAAHRYTPGALLKTTPPREEGGENDNDDGWNGRMLEQDKNTKARIEPVLTKMGEMQTKIDKMDGMQAKIDELQAKVDRIQAENTQMRAENKQMQAENEARAKITEEKLDLIVSLMKPRT